QRGDRLRRDLPLLHHDRQFAAAARDDLTAHKQVVAKINEFFVPCERLFTNFTEAHHRLNAGAVTRLQACEAELAGVALKDDAPCDAHGLAALAVDLLLEVTPARTHFADCVGDG